MSIILQTKYVFVEKGQDSDMPSFDEDLISGHLVSAVMLSNFNFSLNFLLSRFHFFRAVSITSLTFDACVLPVL